LYKCSAENITDELEDWVGWVGLNRISVVFRWV